MNKKITEGICLQCGSAYRGFGKKFCSISCYYASGTGRRGTKQSDECKKKISQKLTGRTLHDRSGERHYNWNPDREEVKRKNKLYAISVSLVGRCLRGKYLGKKTFELLGYDQKQLRDRLQSLFKPGMTWENHGRGPDKWHVDHIQPVSSFPSEIDIKIVNALSNLQPLWEHDNLVKGRFLSCPLV